SVAKPNVLVVSQRWREIVPDAGRRYPDVKLDHLLVDNCAMALVAEPKRFDTIVTENTFGDILSDEAAIIAGSMGMLPSASLGEPRGERPVGLYEPIHGTAPDIAGQGIANPLAAVRSAGVLLRYSLPPPAHAGPLHRPAEAERVATRVERTLAAGYRTKDIHTAGTTLVGTTAMADRVIRELQGLYR